jgi:radical SAM-linked protein
VQRVRLRYAKRGRLRFSSHRDFQRAFERALRRAAVPVAFSQGFTPHPRVSYANAAPMGAASEAEYVEVLLAEPCDPDDLRERLDAALPDGLDVVELVECPLQGAEPLADRLQLSHWRFVLPGVLPSAAEEAVARFVALSEAMVTRMTAKGPRVLDVRGAVESLQVVDADAEATGPLCAILEAVVQLGTPTVRPDDVLAGLRDHAGLALVEPPVATRLAQGPRTERTGTVGDPLAPDRALP